MQKGDIDESQTGIFGMTLFVDIFLFHSFRRHFVKNSLVSHKKKLFLL